MHYLHEFVLDAPCGTVANTKCSSQFKGRDIVLGLSQKVHGPEPDNQWQLGSMKDRATGQSSLRMAMIALKGFDFAVPQNAVGS
jgi:hypothetical protein